jgi:hypothetical protein
VAWRGCRGALVGREAVAAEAHAMELLISVMVDRESSLSEMTKPERLQGEDMRQYQARKARERVVIINPNVADDEVGEARRRGQARDDLGGEDAGAEGVCEADGARDRARRVAHHGDAVQRQGLEDVGKGGEDDAEVDDAGDGKRRR